jgi:DNA-binding YbaB/EbfC family protein
MLDALKNLGNLPGIMAKAREMQDKMKVMQDDLAKRQVSADAGGGIATAIVNGRMELIKLRIDKSKIDVEKDTELLEDVIVAAVAAAQNKAAAMVQQEMAKVTADMGLPPGMLPGM